MKRFLRQVFLENVGLKIVALALSCVLFLYVQGERQRDAVTGALVKLNLVAPRGKVLTVDPVDKLALTLRGQRSAIQRLMSEGLPPITIDLAGRARGPLHFTSDMFQVPRGMTIESIQPPQIDVDWEDRVSRVVPLVPRIAGKPAAGYRVSQVTAIPNEVTVAGPRSTVESIQEIELREVRIDGRDDTAEFTVPVQVQRKYVHVRPEAARLVVEITGEVVTKRLSRVPVRVLNAPSTVEVEVSPREVQQVEVEGPAPVLARLEAADLRTVVDVGEGGELKPGTYLRTPRVENLPRGARVVRTLPASVSVVVRRKVTKENER